MNAIPVRLRVNVFVSGPRTAAAMGALAVAGALSGLPAAAQEHCGGEYVVEPGDTLSAIAARCDSTVAGLVRANAQVSDPDVLVIGWRLTVPEALGHGPPGPEPAGDVPLGDDQAQATPPADEPGLVRLKGLIADGPECPVLRTPDGQVYSLVGEMSFPQGAHVEVTGRTVVMSFCMRGTTIEVTSLSAIGAPTGQ